MEPLQTKCDRLRRQLGQYPAIAVALSGGADSALLCYLAVQALGSGRVMALTASGSMVPEDEVREAARLCCQLGVRHQVIPAEEFQIEAFRFNRSDRCYHCKKNILSKIRSAAKVCGIPAVADGTNADDLCEDRPGLAAAAELGVRKPLADCGITKQDVLLLLDQFGLGEFHKPPMSCFATRFPVDTELNAEKLSRCEAMEKAIRRAGVQGYMRARIFGDTVKIEAEKQQQIRIVQSAIKQEAEKLGFKTVVLELE